MTLHTIQPATPERSEKKRGTAQPPQDPVEPAYMHESPLRGDPVVRPPAQIPTNSKHLLVLGFGALVLVSAVVLLVWGFVAPAVDPDVPPVAADGELPVPD